MPVPGVDLDQHKACNQRFSKDIVDGGLLANNTGKTSIPHSPVVTANGAHGKKASHFYTEPIYFGTWVDS